MLFWCLLCKDSHPRNIILFCHGRCNAAFVVFFLFPLIYIYTYGWLFSCSPHLSPFRSRACAVYCLGYIDESWSCFYQVVLIRNRIGAYLFVRLNSYVSQRLGAKVYKKKHIFYLISIGLSTYPPQNVALSAELTQ